MLNLRLLSSTLRLRHNRLGRTGNIMLQRLGSLHARPFQATAVHKDTGDLSNTDASQEEVDGGETGK